MDVLENLVAQQEIRDLSAKYAMFLDDHDWDALAQLWTEDAVWSIGDIAFDGRKAVMDFLSGCDHLGLLAPAREFGGEQDLPELGGAVCAEVAVLPLSSSKRSRNSARNRRAGLSSPAASRGGGEKLPLPGVGEVVAELPG